MSDEENRSLAFALERKCLEKAAECRKKGNYSEEMRWLQNAEFWVKVQTREEVFSYVEEALVD